MSEMFPVHEVYDVVRGETIYKSEDWWKAVVLYDGPKGSEVGVYLWKHDSSGWKRKQKYAIESKDDWNRDRESIAAFVEELPED